MNCLRFMGKLYGKAHKAYKSSVTNVQPPNLERNVEHKDGKIDSSLQK